MAFLLLLDTGLLSHAGITHYSQLLTLQHSTKLFLVCFFVVVVVVNVVVVEHNRIPSGKKTVSGIQVVTASQVPAHNRWCVCVAVTALGNMESDLGAQSSSYQKAHVEGRL